MTNKNERQPLRPQRVPLHKQRLISALTREGYVRRWVNDTPGRLDMFVAAGWTFVKGEHNNDSDTLAQDESQMGSAVYKVTNKSADAPSQRSYLMEIPKDWYDEAQQDKQKECDELEESYDPTQHLKKLNADYGFLRKTDTTKN